MNRWGVEWPVVAATGPRPQNLPPAAAAWVRVKLDKAAFWLHDFCGARVALSGFAVGVDLWWAASAVRAGMVLGAHVPCPPNPRWSPADRGEYDRLLALADPKYSHVYAESYTGRCMTDRNAGMLGAATAAVYVWDPDRRRGGTWDAVQVGERLDLPGVHLDPVAQVVRFGRPSTVSR